MSEKKLPEKYDAKTREKFWQNYWAEKKIFAWKNDLPKAQTFVIDTPPPTVSGVLHMGHVFSYSQADFVARFQRMSGKDVFYPMGFDDNGLPTERLVEKIIEKKAGVYEAENGHGSFVKKCREVVDEAEKEFEALFNSIALSVDWEQKYQTISPDSQKISQASFVDLYRKGLVEKKFEPVFWDVSDRTALAQADLIDKEVEGVMNYILFGIEGSNETIEIMTTRPELLPACVAVMVHPEDERYKKFHGKNAITPLFGVKVKIIADDLVQLDKGTGAVMCCTFGDETDIRWWKKHDLPLNVILQKDGKINFDHELVAGKTIKQAKDAIIEALKNTPSQTGFETPSEGSLKGHESEEGLANPFLQPLLHSVLLKQEKITRAVKCAERSGVPIEILVVPQWFVKILDKKDLLKAKAAECNWFPEYMKVRIDQWIDGLAWDWCISRQRFFGVAFPVWYSRRLGEEGKILVADVDQLPCDPNVDLPRGYSREEVTPETDIMDTWATSSISPQLSSKGISDEIAFDKDRHEKLFPADLRPQAHEIIRTWAFYTLVKSTLHQNSIPWKNLMISGWCLAADKTKMSKSKGNVVTPTALIEEKGSDIVRYWASTSHLGADTAYSEDVFKIGQKLITKLFNAAKFASMNFDMLRQAQHDPVTLSLSKGDITEASDIWVLSRLEQVVKRATDEFEKFEYARAREAIEEFFWHDFCDNYLEICKVRSYGLAAEKLVGVELSQSEKQEFLAKQQSAILTLKLCLNTILKLFAPFIPHICDEIYSSLFAEEFEKIGSINARGNWPKFDEKLFDEKFLKIGEAALGVIFEVRKFKSEKNISMKTTVQKILVNCEENLSEISEDLKNVCNAKEIEFVKSGNLVEVIL
ncbi:MAG: valine--tRNA ligase [Proteobacteria bacterium]|nr:valine--tRNA ligase [Pseudomonadota bacterium]